MFITFEGIDGSGKSTQAERLVERLRSSGRPVELLREPGGTPAGEHIRTLLLDPAIRIDPFAELLLFSAARSQLVSERIRPLLDEGVIVICDRFFDSTTAYQGAGRRVAEAAWMHGFHRLVTGGLVPDRTFLITVPLPVAAARRAHREADRMEGAEGDFYERVDAAYRELAAREPARVLVLDGASPIDSLAESIWGEVSELLAQEPV